MNSNSSNNNNKILKNNNHTIIVKWQMNKQMIAQIIAFYIIDQIYKPSLTKLLEERIIKVISNRKVYKMEKFKLSNNNTKQKVQMHINNKNKQRERDWGKKLRIWVSLYTLMNLEVTIWLNKDLIYEMRAILFN